MSETDTELPVTDRPEPPSAADAARAASRAPSRAKVVVAGLLLILALGGWLRFTGLNWDGGTHLHPDERFLTMVGSGLSRNENPLDYLRTSVSTLNPYNIGQEFYVYGNLPMTATVYAAEWAQGVCDAVAQRAGAPWCARVYTGYDGIHLVGRFLSAALDLLTVLFTFLIGRRLYGRRAGLIAAFLMATSVMAIQQSHFFTADNWATFFTTVAIYAAVRAATIGDAEPRWRLRWYVAFGLALGLAVASRINMAPLALVINISAIIWLKKRVSNYELRITNRATTGAGDSPSVISPDDRERHSSLLPHDLERAVIAVALAAAVFLITFRIAQPYAFSDAAMVREAGKS